MAMNKVYARARDGFECEPIEKGIVHYEGVGLIGSATLCGHTDRPEYDFIATDQRANCVGCLAVRDHVKGK